MPNYSGMIAAAVGIVFVVLKALGVEVPGDDARQSLTNALVGIVSGIAFLIAFWRLHFTKTVADTANAQLIVAGHVPLVGTGAGIVPSESDKLNAQQIIRKAMS